MLATADQKGLHFNGHKWRFSPSFQMNEKPSYRCFVLDEETFLYFYFLLFALLWYLGDLIKNQEPTVQGAVQIQIKSPL